MSTDSDLAVVQADVASEIAKAKTAISQAEANKDQGQEWQAIEWLYAATQTQQDLATLANDINPVTPPPPPPPPPPTTVPLPSGFAVTPSTDIVFSGSTLPSYFTAQLDPGSLWNDENIPGSSSANKTNQAAYWNPSQATIANDMLTLTCKKLATPVDGFDYVSGVVTSVGTLPATGWCVRIEAQMPTTVSGAWPALWFLPKTSAQEFDGYEGGWNTSPANEHGHSDLFDSSGQEQKVWATPGNLDLTVGTVIYDFVFLPGKEISVYVDGTQVDTYANTNIVEEAYYLIIEFQMASAALGFHTQISANTPASMEMNVSLVQVYAPA